MKKGASRKRRSWFRGNRRSNKHRPQRRGSSIHVESLEPRLLLDGSGGDDPVITSTDRSAWQDVDGAGTSQYVWISVTLDEATETDVQRAFEGFEQHLAEGNSADVYEIESLKLRLVNFNRFDRSLNHEQFVGLYDNVIEGTWRSETLVGTDARDLIVGHGGNDRLKGAGNDDLLVGGSGYDTFQGGSGDDAILVSGTRNGYDQFQGESGEDRVVAVAPGTIVGINGYENGVEAFEGPEDTIVRDSWRSNKLDFSATRLTGIAEIDAGSGNDTIIASDKSPAAYRGNSGYDTLDAGTQETTWLYAGDGNSYDKFLDNGAATVIAQAETPGTVIGLDGFENGVDIVRGHTSGDTVVRDSWRSNTLDFSSVQFVDVAEVDAGSGNDTVHASNVSPGSYRGNSGYDTLIAGAKDTTWLYAGDGNSYDKFRENGTARVTAKAESAGTVIGIDGFVNGVDRIEGHAAGDTVVRDSWRSNTLDFRVTQLVNISEVDAGSGNDTILASDKSPAAYRGGSGYDVLDAGLQPTQWLFAGNRDGYDTFLNNGPASVEAIAETAGTVIGTDGYENGVDRFQGHDSGDTIIRDSWRSNTLDFSETELTQISEVDAGSGNDTVVASDVTAGSYRGGSGYDKLYAGAADTTWLFAGDGGAYDTLRDNGDATVVAKAETEHTVIGIGSYENGVDVFQGHVSGDTIVRNSWRSETLDFSETRFVDIAEIDAASGNDTVIGSNVTAASYRGGSGNDLLIAGIQSTIWLYDGENDGADSFEHNGNADVRATLDHTPAAGGPTQGTTETGLDQLVDIILNDPGLNRRIDQADISAGAAAADDMNHIILDAISATGLANDDEINTADMYDLNTWIQANHYARWVELHGDDGKYEETGFHLVQNDGATSYLFGAYNAVNTVADGVYHMGFDIVSGRFLNEDGNRNVRVETAAHWLDTLLREDLAAGDLRNPNVDPYVVPTTETGLDQLVEIIIADPGLNQRISTSDIMEGARNANAMNTIIVKAISELGLANDDTINTADVRDLNKYIQANHYNEWVVLHGDDEADAETGFHLVQNDGATTRLYGNNAVNTVADGIFHLGFDTQGDNILNEDGNRNARLETLAVWLDTLLEDDLARGTLKNASVNPYAAGSTKTGLDFLIDVIADDPGLNAKIPTSEITAGATFADKMNHIILDAIKATGAGYDGEIDVYEMYDINAYIQDNHYEDWVTFHGDDEEAAETGFHLVQNDGATTRLYSNNAVNTVADGIYHIGFNIVCGRFLNEDGNKNVSVETAALWLNDLLEADLADRDLVDPEALPDAGEIAAVEVLSVDRVEMNTPDDYHEVPHSDALALANGTVAMSFVADNVTGRRTLFSKDASGYENGGHLTAFVRDGRIEVRIQNEHKSEWLYSRSLIRAGEPHHLAISFGEDGFRIYVDGKLEALRTEFTSGIENNEQSLVIGANVWARSEYRPDWKADYFDGTIEDFAMYKRALTGPEISLLGGGVKADVPTQGTTNSGLDALVDIIMNDPGLYRRVDPDEIAEGAANADAMNHLIIDAIMATGLANDGEINPADMYDLNAWIQDNHYDQWVELHGDDEGDEETGFHLVQNDGASTRLFAQNAVNTVADGIFHMGFDIVCGRFLNEDGNKNVSVETAAWWLDELLEDDLADGSLVNEDVNPYAVGTTESGLDKLVEVIAADPGLNRRIPTHEITTGARAADSMNHILIAAIKATGVANDDVINTADVRDLNMWIQENHYETWVELHGDDECDEETGFHLVQNDGATSRLFDNNAVNTVADGIFHLGFDIQGDRVLNEDGNRNARVETLAWWLNDLLAEDLADGSLRNSDVTPYAEGTTGTGLDQLVSLIAADPGLNQRIATSEITGGGQSADRLNQILLEAIKATGAADDGEFDLYDMININVYVQAHYQDEWIVRHGDDEGDEETGFHLVQNDGATTRLFGENGVNTVADGIYHAGFDIERSSFQNEDGNRNVRLRTAAHWLNQVLRDDLANGGLTDE